MPRGVRSYLGEVSQVGPDPAQLVQHAGVEGCLLLAAAAQLLLAAVVDARPVGREGLGAVRPDAPGDTTHRPLSTHTQAALIPTSAQGQGVLQLSVLRNS